MMTYLKTTQDKSKRNKLPLIHKQGKKWKEATAAGKKSKKDKEKGEEEYTDKDAEKDCDEVQKAIKGKQTRTTLYMCVIL